MIDLPRGIQLVLASGSPRRVDLLRSVGLEFSTRPADIDESLLPGEPPEEYVLRLSAEKAGTVAGDDAIVIGADTTVEVDGEILHKPVDDDDARRMLLLLSGRIHRVHTGVSVVRGDEVRRSLVTTQVEFSTLADTTIDWYIGTAEPIDKAGGYAIQGAGGALVTRIDGSVSNVIGLPLAETLELVRSAATRFV